VSVIGNAWEWPKHVVSCELLAVNNAFAGARRTALARLQQNAKLLGAQGVIGVRTIRREAPWSADVMEFVATGTAMTYDGAHTGDEPFLADLSGPEFWALLAAGYLPVGIVSGSCWWYQVASFASQHALTGVDYGHGANPMMEMNDYTHAFNTARQFTMSRISTEAEAVGAEGIIGMALDTEARTREAPLSKKEKRIDIILQMTAVGTAIVRDGEGRTPIHYEMGLSG
jgi:uncharacterized protein YbjQ (UPF0145 family)